MLGTAKKWLSRGRQKKSDTQQGKKVPLINDGLDTEQDIVATVRVLWDDGRQRMYPKLREWADNVLFYVGEQYAQVGDNPYTWFRESAHPDFARVSINLLKSHVQGWVSRHTRNFPRHETFPMTGDEDDKDRADVTNRLIEWQQSRIDWATEYNRGVLMNGLFGCCYWKGWHDQMKGPLTHPMESLFEGDLELDDEYPDLGLADGIETLECPQCGIRNLPTAEFCRACGAENQNGIQLKFEDLVPKGQVMGEAIAPYEITPAGDWARKFRDIRRLLHSYALSVEEIKERFADHPKVDQIKSGEKGDESEHYLFFMEDTIRGAMGRMGVWKSQRDNRNSEPLDTDNSAIVHELWGARTSRRPKGCFAVVCQNILLWPLDPQDMENPYYHSEIPFVRSEHTPDETHFYPTCDLTQSKAVMREYSERMNKLIDSANRTANPGIIAEKGHGIDFKNKLMTAGELFEPRPGRKVSYMQPPALPTYIMEVTRELRLAIEEIFSDHKPSQGQSQKGDSGVKVQALQAADEARHVPFAERLGATLGHFWKQQVALLTQYADEENVAHLMGDEGERMFFTWERDQLLGQATKAYDDRARIMMMQQGYDLKFTVVPGKSPVTVFRDVQFMLETGLLNPQKDASRIMEMLGYGIQSKVIQQDQRLHASQASRENDDFLDGKEMPPPEMFEHHVLHIEHHAKFTLMDKFRRMDPLKKREFMLHIALHEQSVLREKLKMQYYGQAVGMELAQTFGPPPAPPPEEVGKPAGKPAQRQGPQNNVRRPRPRARSNGR